MVAFDNLFIKRICYVMDLSLQERNVLDPLIEVPDINLEVPDLRPCKTLLIFSRVDGYSFCSVVDTQVDGRLDVRPDNTAVVSGQSTTLRCHIDFAPSRAISWTRRVVDGSSDEVIAFACQLESDFTSVYRLTSDNSGQCDLNINSVNTSLTGYYICRDISDADEQKAYVTIIGKLYSILLTVVMFIINERNNEVK